MLGLRLQGNFLLPFSNIPSLSVFGNIIEFIKEEFLLNCDLSSILSITFMCSVHLLLLDFY